MNHARTPPGLPAACLISGAAIALITLAGCATEGFEKYGRKDLPHELEITSVRRCPTGVTTVWGRPCDPGYLSGDTCVLPGEYVRWSTTDIAGFELDFGRNSPMATNCILKTNGKHYKCMVSKDAKPSEYKYSVALNGCSKKLDPRIIVGTPK